MLLRYPSAERPYFKKVSFEVPQASLERLRESAHVSLNVFTILPRHLHDHLHVLG